MKLGDAVESVIHTVAPNIEQCPACKKRKQLLNDAPEKIYTKFKNNLNSIFK
jgi:hypothetical protein